MSNNPNPIQIRVSGFGGQGVVMMGYVLGKAASIHEGRCATLTQSYGPESRGGASACDVLISTEEIDYPKVTQPHVLVVMSQDAYLTYAQKLPACGVLIIEQDLVELSEQDRQRPFLAIPAQRLAEALGRKVVANMVMLGFLAATTAVVSADALRKAIETTVPKGTEQLNLKAFELGYEHGRQLTARKHTATVS